MKSTAKQEHNLNFNRNSYIPKMCVDPCPVGSTTVANLAFLKPDFEILAICEYFWLFFRNKKSQTKSGFFWPVFSRKGLALEKRCLNCIFINKLL